MPVENLGTLACSRVCNGYCLNQLTDFMILTDSVPQIVVSLSSLTGYTNRLNSGESKWPSEYWSPS